MFRKFQNSYFAYFLMYNFYFLAYALFSTLISVYMLDKGYSASQVSLVVSASFFSSMIVQPLMGILNDKIGIKKVTIYSFLLINIAAIFFMQANNLLLLTVWYSAVLMLVNGVNPVMDVLAARSPYTYGKIRIWGTFGYAMGSQLAGLIYKFISPQAIFIVFISMMCVSILGVFGIEPKHNQGSKKATQTKNGSSIGQIFKNKTYLFYLLIVALYSGVGNTGHTYIPSMLEHSGLSVNMATTVVAISVICESPLIFFSYLFMDKVPIKKLLYIPLGILLLQYVIYGLDLGLTSKILLTLMSKHATGMLLIMVTLKIVANIVDENYLVTAIALVQTARNLGTILIQNIAGDIIDKSGYEMMSFFLAGVMVLVLVLAFFLKVPNKSNQKLFG
ncbi:MFS transporter [Streptococcus constellatus]|uniref:Transporter, major facilitator family protein n=1 Tax=Streptococcus constellatus subsp. constellatus SK53 TaxID=1095730 RepID=A0AAD2Y4F0_STRCV|nr:MFS transporter [Streptococcus constellatus]EID20066.1 transporter, major facilitator family protein [Streptococcus constellatus subsp. constellatus SK53]MDP1484937.1 MFS transporter [Streptococcus constellatus]QQT05661.1 MFS transporter [Streptococcus constellatus]SUN40204.1 putative major facilitator superfamily sugar transporter [Streptococcus constellatus]BBD22267.1 putative major facilitator superfamily sugar transporter [Streptococcus constellatus subsp. constellatus]